MRPLQQVTRSLYHTPSPLRVSFLSLRQGYSYTRFLTTLPRLPIFEALSKHDEKSTSVIHSSSGRSFTYGQLLQDVAIAREKLLSNANGKDLAGERVGFLAENSYDYVGAVYSFFYLFLHLYKQESITDHVPKSDALIDIQYTFYSIAVES